MFSPRLKAFLLIVFVANAFPQCRASYLNHMIDSTICGQSPIAIPSLNDSLVLESSLSLPKSCSIRIERPTGADGLVVVAGNVSIDNGINGGCDNYIKFGSSSMAKWCKWSDVKSLVFSEPTIELEVNINNTSDSYINLVITPFKKSTTGQGIQGQECDKSAPFMCGSSSDDQQLCISEEFRCDGRNNCPQGYDEELCTVWSNTRVYNQKSTTEGITETMTSEDETTRTTRVIRAVETTEPVIKSTIYFSDPNYQIYEVKDFCQHSQQLELFGNITTIPAIIELTANQSRDLNYMDCTLRFQVPSSTFMDGKGLIVGIDSLSLTNDDCEEYIEISGTNTKPSKPEIWCKEKADEKGVSFTTSANGFIDIKFHSANNTNSSFRIVVTQYQGKMLGFCPSSDELRCKSSDNECVSKDFKCDGHRNCPMGEDETGCGGPTPIPTTTTTPASTTTSTTPASNTTTTTPLPITTTSVPTTSTTQQSTTPSTNSSTTAIPPKPDKPGMSGGLIALTVIGVLVAVCLIVCGLYLVRKRRAEVRYDPLN